MTKNYNIKLCKEYNNNNKTKQTSCKLVNLLPSYKHKQTS